MNNGAQMNDNDELTFIRIAAVTANVVRYLVGNKKQDEPSAHDGDRCSTGQRDNAENRSEIDQGLNTSAAKMDRLV